MGMSATNDLDNSSEHDNHFCDDVMNLLINGPEDKATVDFLIQNELQAEFESRNENSELCAHFVNTLVTHLYDVKQKRDDELQFVDEWDLRKKRYRSLKPSYKINFPMH